MRAPPTNERAADVREKLTGVNGIFTSENAPPAGPCGL